MTTTLETGFTDRPLPISNPLDPTRLLHMPLGLEPLTESKLISCNSWYELVAKHADAVTHPDRVNPDTQQQFARLIHRVVSNGVSTDVNNQNHPIVDREAVKYWSNDYYSRFGKVIRRRVPGQRTVAPEVNEQLRRLEKGRIVWQDVTLETAHKYHTTYPMRFLEIGVLYGIRRAFYDREMKQPAKAIFGLLTAYGKAIETQYK